ncbi:MAG: RNase H family protein [Halarcobacter sp.]
MNKIKLFCDGSVNPQKKTGFAAYFIYDKNLTCQNINLKKFENTSSTKLELEALLWALEDETLKNKQITVYTDCQNILGLFNRKEKLEKNSYLTSTGKTVKNHELYKEFFTQCDKLDICFEKVEGHKKSSLKNEIDNLFNLVDKASRKALREYLIPKY